MRVSRETAGKLFVMVPIHVPTPALRSGIVVVVFDVIRIEAPSQIGQIVAMVEAKPIAGVLEIIPFEFGQGMGRERIAQRGLGDQPVTGRTARLNPKGILFRFKLSSVIR